LYCIVLYFITLHYFVVLQRSYEDSSVDENRLQLNLDSNPCPALLTYFVLRVQWWELARGMWRVHKERVRAPPGAPGAGEVGGHEASHGQHHTADGARAYVLARRRPPCIARALVILGKLKQTSPQQ
jgi:hypothetical protein